MVWTTSALSTGVGAEPVVAGWGVMVVVMAYSFSSRGVAEVRDLRGVVTGTPSGRNSCAIKLAEAAFSRARKAPSSPIVLISGAGKTTVVFLSTPISTMD